MAIAASNLTNGVLNSGATSYTTASISPTANALVIVSVASNVASSAAPTVSGASGTWTSIGSRVDAAGSRRITMFRDLSAAPGSGILTISFGAVTQTNCAWSVDQFTNTDISGTHGSGAIVQSVGNSTTSGTTTSFTVTLAALGSSANAAYGMVRNNTATTIVKGSSFTELANSAVVTTEAEWALNQTAVNWTWASQTVVSVGFAVEIKAAIAPNVNSQLGVPFNDISYRNSFFDGSAFLPNIIQGHVSSYLGAPFNTLSYLDSSNIHSTNPNLFPSTIVANPFFGLSFPILFNAQSYKDSFFDGSAFLPRIVQCPVQSQLGVPFNPLNYRDSFFDGSAFSPNIIQCQVSAYFGAPFNTLSYRDSYFDANAILPVFQPAPNPFVNVWVIQIR